MFRIVIPVLIVALVVFVFLAGKRGLIRGVADDMLVSPARPAVAVDARAELKLVDARRADLSPAVQGNTLASSSVQLCYALYQRPLTQKEQPAPDAGDVLTGSPSEPVVPVPSNIPAKARLVALLAVAEAPYTWPVQPDTEPRLSVLRSEKKELAGYDGFAETFVLPDEEDPWSAVKDEPDDAIDPWRKGSLVRRYTFMLWQRRAKLMVEYREPLPTADILPLADNVSLLAAFEKRALESFLILNGDISTEKLPHPTQNLPYPPETVNRRALTTYIGELWETRN